MFTTDKIEVLITGSRTFDQFQEFYVNRKYIRGELLGAVFWDCIEHGFGFVQTSFLREYLHTSIGGYIVPEFIFDQCFPKS